MGYLIVFMPDARDDLRRRANQRLSVSYIN